MRIGALGVWGFGVGGLGVWVHSTGVDVSSIGSGTELRVKRVWDFGCICGQLKCVGGRVRVSGLGFREVKNLNPTPQTPHPKPYAETSALNP